MEYEYTLLTKDICDKISDEDAGFALSADYIFAFCQANEIEPKSLSHDDAKNIIEHACNLKGNTLNTAAIQAALGRLAAGDAAGAGALYKKILNAGKDNLIILIERDTLKEKYRSWSTGSKNGVKRSAEIRTTNKTNNELLVKSEETRLKAKGFAKHEITSQIVKTTGLTPQYINKLKNNNKK